ncbi:hypothetical protein BaRGS_00000536 [Batillaria attramentaria]|uniref:Uncharacterized protein n=1 Tax=Batillaria attramentaria TaxID=370345 RepID=A0ABD0M9P6_9CAEN
MESKIQKQEGYLLAESRYPALQQREHKEHRFFTELGKRDKEHAGVAFSKAFADFSGQYTTNGLVTVFRFFFISVKSEHCLYRCKTTGVFFDRPIASAPDWTLTKSGDI